MIIIEKENYRLCTITKVTDFTRLPSSYGVKCEELQVKDGLAIKKKCENDNSWYVIAFIKYNDNESCCDIKSVGTRILEIDEDEWATVCRLIKTRCEVVYCANS